MRRRTEGRSGGNKDKTNLTLTLTLTLTLREQRQNKSNPTAMTLTLRPDTKGEHKRKAQLQPCSSSPRIGPSEIDHLYDGVVAALSPDGVASHELLAGLLFRHAFLASRSYQLTDITD